MSDLNKDHKKVQCHENKLENETIWEYEKYLFPVELSNIYGMYNELIDCTTR